MGLSALHRQPGFLILWRQARVLERDAPVRAVPENVLGAFITVLASAVQALQAGSVTVPRPPEARPPMDPWPLKNDFCTSQTMRRLSLDTSTRLARWLSLGHPR